MSSAHRVASAYLAKRATAPQQIASNVKQQVNAELKKRGLTGVQMFRTTSQVVSLVLSVLQNYNLSVPSLTPVMLQRDKGGFRLGLEMVTDSDPLNPAKVQNSVLALQYTKTPTGQFTATVQLA